MQNNLNGSLGYTSQVMMVIKSTLHWSNAKEVCPASARPKNVQKYQNDCFEKKNTEITHHAAV